MPRISRLNILVAHNDPLRAAGLGVTLGKRPDFDVAVCEPASPAMNATTLHSHSAFFGLVWDSRRAEYNFRLSGQNIGDNNRINFSMCYNF
jgi:hypothetical protein